jgi:hypothetical protein
MADKAALRNLGMALCLVALAVAFTAAAAVVQHRAVGALPDAGYLLATSIETKTSIETNRSVDGSVTTVTR